MSYQQSSVTTLILSLLLALAASFIVKKTLKIDYTDYTNTENYLETDIIWSGSLHKFTASKIMATGLRSLRV